jgi:hypothetical protein
LGRDRHKLPVLIRNTGKILPISVRLGKKFRPFVKPTNHADEIATHLAMSEPTRSTNASAFRPKPIRAAQDQTISDRP